MLEHVRALGILGIVRSLLAAGIGILLLWKSQDVSLQEYSKNRFELEAPVYNKEDRAVLSFDRNAFTAVGLLCLGFAFVRLAQGVGALLWRGWARPLGLGLACFDVFNLALFPLSTALGLYGLVVYRKAEMAERFGAVRSIES